MSSVDRFISTYLIPDVDRRFVELMMMTNARSGLFVGLASSHQSKIIGDIEWKFYPEAWLNNTPMKIDIDTRLRIKSMKPEREMLFQFAVKKENMCVEFMYPTDQMQ